jgi:hypothetical protein
MPSQTVPENDSLLPTKNQWGELCKTKEIY